ncbi:MAG: hypothetical protein AB8B96_12095 [Lysobacterales bacterium]
MNTKVENTHWAHSVGIALGLGSLLATQIATAWAISSWLIY